MATVSTTTKPTQHGSPGTRRSRLAGPQPSTQLPARAVAGFVADELKPAANWHSKKNSDDLGLFEGVVRLNESGVTSYSMPMEVRSHDWCKIWSCVLLCACALLFGFYLCTRMSTRVNGSVHHTTELGYDYVSRSGCQCTVSIPRGMAVTIQSGGTETATISGGPQPMQPVTIRENEKIAVAEAGQYQLVFNSAFASLTPGTIVTVAIYLNSVAIPFAQQSVAIGVATRLAGQSIHLSTLRHLSAGDALDVRWSTTSNKKATSILCFARSFYAIRLGPL